MLDANVALGADIRERREAAGLSRLKLAVAAGVSPATVQNIEGGYAPERGTATARVLAALDDVEASSW